MKSALVVPLFTSSLSFLDQAVRIEDEDDNEEEDDFHTGRVRLVDSSISER